MIMEFTEQKKEVVDGVPRQYLCHVQSTETAGNVYPAHYHSYIEVLFGLRGDFEIFLNGKKHVFGKDELLMVNPREIHLINAVSPGGGEYIVLRFEPEVIYAGMSANYLNYLIPQNIENPSQERVIVKNPETGEFRTLFKEINDELKDRDYGYELAVKTGIERIFLNAARYWHKMGINIIRDTGKPEIQKLLSRLQPAFDYVREHYKEEITAQYAAKLCGMSYSYFSRRLNSLLGINFSKYVNFIRITEAEKLLINEDVNITEAALGAGLPDASYFSKLFRKYRGITPKEFKKEMKKQG